LWRRLTGNKEQQYEFLQRKSPPKTKPVETAPQFSQAQPFNASGVQQILSRRTFFARAIRAPTRTQSQGGWFA
jgi:hypothetical protein